MARHRLSDKRIANTKTPGHLADGGNLYIQIAEPRVNKDGKQVIAKSWVFRYTSPVFGRPREMGLGPYPAVSLADARLLASEQHTHLQRGDDPIEIRNTKRDRVRVEATKRKSFAECANEYIAAHSDAWSNDSAGTHGSPRCQRSRPAPREVCTLPSSGETVRPGTAVTHTRSYNSTGPDQLQGGQEIDPQVGQSAV